MRTYGDNAGVCFLIQLLRSRSNFPFPISVFEDDKNSATTRRCVCFSHSILLTTVKFQIGDRCDWCVELAPLSLLPLIIQTPVASYILFYLLLLVRRAYNRCKAGGAFSLKSFWNQKPKGATCPEVVLPFPFFVFDFSFISV